MDLAVKKVEIIEWLVQLTDEEVIGKVEKLKKNSIKESYESKLKPMKAKEYKKLLAQAEEDFKNGNVTRQEEVEKESENW